jgi:ADP-heptose:LPS heptosyltransferase
MDVRSHLAGLRRWLSLVRRHGRPHRLFYFYGGIGDQLLCSAVARELQRRRPQRIWFFSQAPELFAQNADVTATVPFDLGLIPWARLSGSRPQRLFYQDFLHAENRDAPLHEPSIASLCRRAGLTGTVTLRPYLPAVTPAPLPTRTRPRIAIHSSCLTARYPMANKQWPVERLQAVARELSAFADLVQLGSPQDPDLPGALDRRGLPLLDAARELSTCDLFVGLVGFLMHLARAVECPAVIVYGGREPPEITGYSCNTNLADRPACAPCWHYSQCDYDRRCLTAITPEQVLAAVRAQLGAARSRPLRADEFAIAA